MRAGLDIRWNWDAHWPGMPRPLGVARGPGPQCALNSAALHFAHGLRPIQKANQKIPYVQAQRDFLFLFLYATAGNC